MGVELSWYAESVNGIGAALPLSVTGVPIVPLVSCGGIPTRVCWCHVEVHWCSGKVPDGSTPTLVWWCHVEVLALVCWCHMEAFPLVWCHVEVLPLWCVGIPTCMQ